MAAEESYKLKADVAIRDTLLRFECQPILFVGSGIAMRYFGAPTWHNLLRAMFEKTPEGIEGYEYNRQKYGDDPVAIGTALADTVFEWAWRDGRNKFPSEMFTNGAGKDTFLKYMVCQHLTNLLSEAGPLESPLQEEVSALAEIKPHAVITTNYDQFLEKVLDGYEPITGQTIIRYNTNSFGEIFHIHGDVSDPSSLVLTDKDYEEWRDKKKYVSAKLLTYFAEHPVFILGYGLGDDNVKAILRDIGELVADETGLIDNVFQVIWHQDPIATQPPEQAVFDVDGQEFRTQAIHTNDLLWVFKALKSQSALTSINPKLVRALAARTMRLIRHDIPSGSVAVDYDVLERVAADGDELPKLLGITAVENANQSHPFTLSQVAKRVGLPNWQAVNKIINEIKDSKGIDLRSTDNRYHCKIKTGTKDTSITRKWSHEAVSLFEKYDKVGDVDLNL
ncbi:hypothetical protein MB02_01125 [Croceicoccus estronivorus]|uniref:SIR2 family NAD-dependent protein deacylase n=1 Tax=Croceicoccus estronivorus TaxID=1172626 RepID=UPI00082D3FDA|nr:SIR2 family protein [Croceicoccus estronivorus]OCC25305.1 hypothetical protein MB02_01125 [Croceicoccus estronivorus]